MFQQLRLVWTQLRDQVSAQDELDMAKMRLRTRFPDEPVPQSNKKQNPLQQLSSNIGSAVETIHIIEKHQVCTAVETETAVTSMKAIEIEIVVDVNTVYFTAICFHSL
jgi:hypothetical protein